MIAIESPAFRLVASPEVGGSIAALDWHGQPLLRAASGSDVLNSACFPLVPFSNRIAGSRFRFGGREVVLKPNHPHAPSEPVLHGFGWQRAWTVTAHQADRLALALDLPAGDWPWPFLAEQLFALNETSATLTLAITNRGETPMPAGLGFHPYFPRTATTRLIARHRGEWQVDAARLPTRLDLRETAIDWWAGQPVASRLVDTVYTGRDGDLVLAWPARGIGLAIAPDDSLPFTTIYVPADAEFVCVEPVSHATNALNRPGEEMRVLAPGARWQVELRLTPFRLG
jgi:aldose 1-epimerase